MKENRISENTTIAASQFLEEKSFWTAKLAGEWEKSYFDYDYPLPGTAVGQKNKSQPDNEPYRQGQVPFRLSNELFSRLTEISRGSAPNLHMVLTAAVVALLARYNSSSDIIVGTSIDRQEHNPGEQLVNTLLPLRIQLHENMTFKELLMETRSSINDAIDNQNYPLEVLAREKDAIIGQETFHGFPLFDVAVILENIQDSTYLAHIHHNLTFSFRQTRESIKGKLEYHAGLYGEHTPRRIINHYIRLLEIALFNAGHPLSRIDLVSEAEKKQLIEFNQTRADYPADKSIHWLFEAQVRKTPDHIALIEPEPQKINSRTSAISYRELNESANHLARLLKEKGTQPGNIIGLMAQPSIELVIGILAALKAGAAYLPIDPAFPEERIHYMLTDCSVRQLLAHGTSIEHREELKKWAGETIFLDGKYKHTCRKNLPKTTRQHLMPAYVIYTSGTSGIPKGVVIHHQALVNYCCWAARQYVGDQYLYFPLYTSISFDLTVTSIFTPIISGCTIAVYRGENREFLPEQILAENMVDVIKLTPTHLSMIQDKPRNFASVKRLILGGEDLKSPLARKIYNNVNGSVTLYNEYGPTEATVGCMLHSFNPDADQRPSVPLGNPAHNVEIYLLDKNQFPVPHGVPGEIYISGASLARGYLNQPELTAKKFCLRRPGGRFSRKLPPWTPHKSFLLTYCSGDLARWFSPGMIEFLGRIDNQVKIKGFRIELGEIQYRLSKIEEIIDCAVTVRRSGGNESLQLCAYYVARNSSFSSLSPGQLRELLLTQLPEYMVPSFFIPLDQIPVTNSGKINLQDLPDPLEYVNEEVEYLEPRNDIEHIMTKTWQDILGIEKIGINDGYFTLGGDSVKAIQIAAALQNHQLKMEIADLFQYPTIGSLSPFVTPLKVRVSQEPVQGSVPLTPIQHWFFEKDPDTVHPFNMSVMLYRQETFDEHILEKVFQRLPDHHDALRMSFDTEENNHVSQFNHGFRPDKSLLEITDYRDNHNNNREINIREESNRFQRRINLKQKDSLLKAKLFKTPRGDYLLIAVHHLVMDAVSMRILLEDFEVLYKGIQQGQDIALPLKTTSFKEWAHQLYDYANSTEFLEELDYWMKPEQPVPPLPRDSILPRNQKKRKDTNQESIALSPEDTAQLLRNTNQAYNTEINDVLLTALALALKQWANTETALVNLEGHGREEIIKDIDITRTIGWFTSFYPVVLDMRFPDDPGSMIIKTKEMLRKVPGKGIGYGLLKYLTQPGNKKNFTFQNEPEISFNYLGQFDRDMNSDLYRMAEIPLDNPISPNMEIPHALEFIALVANQRLSITITYHKQEFNENRISALAQAYLDQLLTLIRHCVSREEIQLTVSDLSANDLSQEEMDSILGELQENLGD